MPYLTVPYVFFLLSPGPFVFPVETDPMSRRKKRPETPVGLAPKDHRFLPRAAPFPADLWGRRDNRFRGPVPVTGPAVAPCVPPTYIPSFPYR